MAKQRKNRRSWCLPDAMWNRMEPLLPHYPKSPQGGRPRCDLRKIANGIFYVLRTGCQWKASPREYGYGVPLGVEVSGANTHDIKLLQATFDSVPIQRPQPTSRRHYQPHVKSRGQEESQRKKNPRFKARRWVVERIPSWINRFRRLLVRWEKKAENYLAMLHLSFTWTTLSSAGVLG